MNRRSFLSSAIAAATALTLDPEKLLWVPGKKLISIPVVSRADEIDRWLREVERIVAEHIHYGNATSVDRFLGLKIPMLTLPEPPPDTQFFRLTLQNPRWP